MSRIIRQYGSGVGQFGFAPNASDIQSVSAGGMYPEDATDGDDVRYTRQWKNQARSMGAKAASNSANLAAQVGVIPRGPAVIFRSQSGMHEQPGIPMGVDAEAGIGVMLKPDGSRVTIPLDYLDEQSQYAFRDARPVRASDAERARALDMMDRVNLWRESQPKPKPNPMLADQIPSGADLMQPMEPADPGSHARDMDRMFAMQPLPNRHAPFLEPPAPAKPPEPAPAVPKPDARVLDEVYADIFNKPREPVADAGPVDSGPESLKPAPGEETEPSEAPAAAQAKARPLPVPPSSVLRDRFVNTIWSAYGNAYERLGFSKAQFQAAYNAAVINNPNISHRQAVEAVRSVLAEAQSAHKQATGAYWADQNAMDSEARRMGLAPGVWRAGRHLSNATPGEQLGILAALHASNPYAGWGNLAAMMQNNQSRERQAANMGAGAAKPTGFAAMDGRLAEIKAMGATPGVIEAYKDYHMQRPGADPKQAGVFAVGMATENYMKVHGKDLSDDPGAEQFVRQYLSNFQTWDEYQSVTGLPKTPENVAWFEKYSGRSAKTTMEWLGSNVLQPLGGALQAGFGAYMGAGTKPADE